MERQPIINAIPKGLWFSFFLFPLAYLAYRLFIVVEFETSLQLSALWQAFQQTIYLSIAGTFGAMSLGFIIAVGLLASNHLKYLKPILLLPAFTPSLFLITSVITWFDILKLDFVPGFFQVVFLHILTDAGFAAVLTHDLVLSKMKPQLRLALIEGATRWQVYRACWVNLKSEFFYIASAFFMFCFTSFSIPLIVGGQSGRTLEVLAYEQLTLKADIWGAAIVALVQMLSYAVFVYFIRSEDESKVQREGVSLKSFGIRFLAAPLAILLFIICYFGVLADVPQGLSLLMNQNPALEILPELLKNSLVFSFMAGASSFLLFCFLLYYFDFVALRKFLLSYGAISVVLMGISVLLMDLPLLWRLTYVYSLLFFPIAFRLYGPELFGQLKPQRQILKTLGGSSWLNFKTVIFPQALPSLLRLAGIVAIWAVGDYGITSVVTGETLTLALFTKNLLSGYRIELASLICFMLLLLVVSIYLIFEWLSYVCSKKLFS